MKLFGKDINVKTHYCSINGSTPVKIKPRMNVYIQLGGCNANCQFCEFKDHGVKFDFDKFETKLLELSKQITIGKISITGGEPTLYYYRLVRIVKIIRKHFPDNFLVLNTNGFNLLRLHNDNLIKNFDSISVSRHHWNDIINTTIFKTESIDSETLKFLVSQYENIFHLSCNMIKGNIDNPEDIYEYLEYAASVGIYDVGFVGLMELNEYCKEHRVEVDLRKYENDRFINFKNMCFGKSCKCFNYVYIPENPLNGTVNVYSRHVLGKSDVIQMVVFDGQNIKLGFDGDILI